MRTSGDALHQAGVHIPCISNTWGVRHQGEGSYQVTWQPGTVRRMVEREVLAWSREIPPGCKLAPGHAGTVKYEELVSKF